MDDIHSNVKSPQPAGYRWLVTRGLIGWQPNSALQPWYFIPEEEQFRVNSKWPQGPAGTKELIAFARRQDDDIIACFDANRVGDEVVVINGWTSSGYDIVQEFYSFWDWVKSVIDDVAEWSKT